MFQYLWFIITITTIIFIIIIENGYNLLIHSFPPSQLFKLTLTIKKQSRDDCIQLAGMRKRNINEQMEWESLFIFPQIHNRFIISHNLRSPTLPHSNPYLAPDYNHTVRQRLMACFLAQDHWAMEFHIYPDQQL